MRVKIMNSTGVEWYKDCIGKVFIVQSESRKGGRGKYVVRTPKDLKYLTNGYMYGWVDKEHCKEIYIPRLENGKCSRCKSEINFKENEYEPSLKHGICGCGINFTIGD